MERKLAHIEKIEWIKPIKDADKIELCGILGWQCVITKKDKFKVGDSVVYIEIDSILPERKEFEFLRERKFRIKTIKLRGELSQGICFPVDILPYRKDYHTGMDVTDIIGVEKYFSPSERAEQEEIERRIKRDKNKLRKFMLRYSWVRKLFLSRTKKSRFPYWVSKTDEERIQNIPQVIEQFKDENVYVTEKIDCQSGTWTGKMIPRFSGIIGKIIPVKKYKFVVCSRNLTTNNKKSLYWIIAEKYNLENVLRKNPNITIQGEQGDTKVQGNKYKLEESKMWVFNIIDHGKNYLYDYDEMVEFCEKHNLDYVSLITKCKISDIGNSVNDFIEYSKGKSVLANIPREGVVIRSTINGQKMLSFKVVNPDFLLKYED